MDVEQTTVPDKPSFNFTKKLQQLVEEAKTRNEKWRAEYMTLEMIKTEERTIAEKKASSLAKSAESSLAHETTLLRLHIKR